MADTDILKLTDAVSEQASFVLYTTPVDSTKGLSISFDFYAYGGRNGTDPTVGGDGIGFFFVDGAASPTRAGGFGGSLGYAQRTDVATSGIEGGYLGIGFDEFGNFSSASEGRVGGIGQSPDAIAVRGSQVNSYVYLTGVSTLPVSLDNPGPQATRENSRRRAQIDLSPQGVLNVQVDLNNDNDFDDAGEKPIVSYDVVTNNGALPTSFKFGFAGSTGAATNIHEVSNFKITTTDGTPLQGSFTVGSLVTGTGTQTGTSGTDTLINTGGGTRPVVQTGGRGGDIFTFSGSSKAAALKTSTVRSVDRITDFNFAEGDRFRLDFDSNQITSELPKGVFNAGRITARNLTDAVKLAYADKNQQKRKAQSLRADEAVFFRLGSRTYLSVNNSRTPFATNADLVADVTGIQFKTGDVRKGALAVGSYFT